MSELQRQAYLKAMGVDCYIPRLSLPGAPVSQLYALPDVAYVDNETEVSPNITASPAAIFGGEDRAAPGVAVASASNTTSASAATSGRGAAMDLLRGELGAEPAKNAPQPVAELLSAATKAVQQAGAGPESTPHFALSIIRGGNVLLIDEGLTGQTDPTQYLQLLQNMLQALGAKPQALSIDAFVWPMIKHSAIDQTEQAARQTLEAFLAKQIEQLSTRYIVLMGATASRYVVDDTPAQGEFIAHQFSAYPQLSAQLICTQSAALMLTDPQLKRQLWSDLQPLHRVLKVN